MRTRRTRLHPLVLAAAAFLGACSSTTEVRPDQEALDAAAQFRQLADDAFRAGAEPGVTNAYREIGLALDRNGRVSPVTVVIDGTPLDFLATAQQAEFPNGPACTGVQSFCLTLPPLRSVIAWEKSNPRRVVQVTASAGTTTIGGGTQAAPSMAIPGISALAYFDGAGGAYFGTTGTQSIGDPVLSGTPCHPTPPPGVVSAPEVVRCTLAEFSASFSGTVAVPPFAIRGNTASGTHTIAMAPQPVHGARLELMMLPFCFACEGYPREALPPVSFRTSALQASLTATATASLVTLELRVTNPLTEPATLQFSSGQQYDFRVRRLDGSVVWVWSADKLFTTALGSRTLAPGETVTYTETWAPTVHQSLIADGRLTSTSHFAAASAAFTVP